MSFNRRPLRNRVRPQFQPQARPQVSPLTQALIQGRRPNIRPIAMPKPPSENPQYPGERLGLSFEEYQEVIQNQVRMKGFRFDLASGVNEDLSIQLSGSAYLMLGFLFVLPAEANFFDPTNYPFNATLQINNEQAISSADLVFFSPGSQALKHSYVDFVRPLSGQDDITLSCNSPQLQTLSMIIYYL